jgi:hypothetical protein
LRKDGNKFYKSLLPPRLKKQGTIKFGGQMEKTAGKVKGDAAPKPEEQEGPQEKANPLWKGWGYFLRSQARLHGETYIPPEPNGRYRL